MEYNNIYIYIHLGKILNILLFIVLSTYLLFSNKLDYCLQPSNIDKIPDEELSDFLNIVFNDAYSFQAGHRRLYSYLRAHTPVASRELGKMVFPVFLFFFLININAFLLYI